jgi:hypothetical protein
MKMQDNLKQDNLKLEDVALGDLLVFDAGFTCIKENSVLEVQQDGKGELFVNCDKGGHYLHGMEDAHGVLQGVKKVPEGSESV